MGYLFLMLAATLQVFVIGVAMTWLVVSSYPICIIGAPEVCQEQQTIQSTDQSRTEYKSTKIADGEKKDGTSLIGTDYEKVYPCIGSTPAMWLNSQCSTAQV
jgi:hypothetical protein